MHAQPTLQTWSPEAVDAECSVPHSEYDADLSEHYTEYFAKHPAEAGRQRFSARSIGEALPRGWGRLAALLPAGERHRHHLSGKSSQLLALGLLGVAAARDPGLGWLWRALDLTAPSDGEVPAIAFERTLAPAVLDERPRQTAVDVLVETEAVVVCIEAKLREDGMGMCSCQSPERECSTSVLARRRYWETAREDFGLTERTVGEPCPISLGYQAVRNVAAARALAGQRRAVFALLYDERNPYFRATGDWPGWPAVLAASLAGSEPARFRAVSWQELVPLLPLDDSARAWAAEKHGFGQ